MLIVRFKKSQKFNLKKVVKLFLKALVYFATSWRAQKLTGENLNVVWAKLSTLS